MEKAFKTTITGCARCGMEHKYLKFERLDNPTDNYEWWSICPSTGQPILLSVVEGEQAGGKRSDDPRQTRPL